MIDTITETKDFVDAIYKAVPKKCRVANRKRGPRGGLLGATPLEKALTIYKCFDGIDWDLAWRYVVANAIEDLVFGQLSRASAKSSRAMDAPVEVIDPQGRVFRKMGYGEDVSMWVDAFNQWLLGVK